MDDLLTKYPPPRVASLGRSIFDPIWREREHRGTRSELLHVLSGSVDLVTRDCTIHGEEGDTLYTPTGCWHRDVFPPATTFEVYLIHFEWEGEAELLRRCPPSRLARVPEPAKARIAADFRQLYQDFRRRGPLIHELTSLRLLQIILTLLHEATAEDAADEPALPRAAYLMSEARRVIQRRYHEPLTLEEIAAELHVSPYHLSHVFSAESGFTLLSYLTSVRMEQAAEQLRRSRDRVAKVAAAVGFRDPQYFSRVFRMHFGDTPSAYRARHAGGGGTAP